MKKLIIIFVVLSISTSNLYSQNRTIEGRVISDFIERIPGVSIMVNDTVDVGRTDLNGFFRVDIPDSIRKILFISVGAEPTIIKFTDTCAEIEVVMMLAGTYDFMTPRKVDRLRMKRFNKLPELHKEAFAKGIFKTDEACYTQEFLPFNKKNQK